MPTRLWILWLECLSSLNGNKEQIMDLKRKKERKEISAKAKRMELQRKKTKGHENEWTKYKKQESYMTLQCVVVFNAHFCEYKMHSTLTYTTHAFNEFLLLLLLFAFIFIEVEEVYCILYHLLFEAV